MLNPSQSEYTGIPIYAAAKMQRAQSLDLILSLANAKALMGSIYGVIFLLQVNHSHPYMELFGPCHLRESPWPAQPIAAPHNPRLSLHFSQHSYKFPLSDP